MWEWLPPLSTSSVLEELSLEEAVVSTDCLASHFTESAADFFGRLVQLDLHLRGDYDKIALPLKVCTNLVGFRLDFEYSSETTPFQIGEKGEEMVEEKLLDLVPFGAAAPHRFVRTVRACLSLTMIRFNLIVRRQFLSISQWTWRILSSIFRLRSPTCR